MTTLEKIRAEIDEQTEIHSDGEFYIKNIDVKRILAKYAEPSEENLKMWLEIFEEERKRKGKNGE